MIPIKSLHKIAGIIFLLAAFLNTSAQLPKGFNYQAIAHQNNEILSNSDLNIEISIIQGNPTSNPLFTETHDVNTNNQGLFSLVIGEGIPVLATIEDINWSLGDYYLSVKFKKTGDNTFPPADVVKLQSVPYALFAESTSGTGWAQNADTVYSLSNVAIGTSEAGKTELTVQGMDIASEEPLFEVKRKDGIPVFAVFNDGVMVYVNENAKGVKGGFAVGGYNAVSKSLTNEYLRVTPDSVRIYINDDNNKASVKGGFAVGGYNSVSKSPGKEYLRVTNDSTRVYVNNDSTKGVKGGFAVGGYNSSKSDPFTFMSLTPQNYFIGHESGSSITSGTLNAFIGYQSGKKTKTGSNNVFLGPKAGMNNISGNSNVIIGASAGEKNNGHYNVFIGYESGMNNISGADSRFSKWNTFIGYQSGRENTTGWQNIAIGYMAGYNNQTATNQLFIGNNAGESVTDGINNTFVGHYSGNSSDTVSENTFIGYQAGYRNVSGSGNTYLGNASGMKSTGSGNVFIGNRVGWNEMGDNKLYIDNSSSASPLIYGDFESNNVKINGSLGVNVVPSTSPFAVAELPSTTSGTNVRYYKDNFYYSSSSRATKEDIQPLTEDFHKILQAKPVSFRDKNSGERNIGFIAEEFDALGLENLVIYNDGKPISLSYELVSLYNLEIIKEQQKALEQKDIHIKELEERIAKIEATLEMK